LSIELDNDLYEITQEIKHTDGFLDCEKIIIKNIREQFENGMNEKHVENYLIKLRVQMESRIELNKNTINCTNYRYAAGFINTLLKIPFLRNWLKTINM